MIKIYNRLLHRRIILEWIKFAWWDRNGKRKYYERNRRRSWKITWSTVNGLWLPKNYGLSAWKQLKTAKATKTNKTIKTIKN